jgi:hypothetical protein
MLFSRLFQKNRQFLKTLSPLFELKTIPTLLFIKKSYIDVRIVLVSLMLQWLFVSVPAFRNFSENR